MKKIKLSEIKITSTFNNMSEDKKYGYKKCPLDEDKPCFDFDRLGAIACGLCGANKELAGQGQENFFERN